MKIKRDNVLLEKKITEAESEETEKVEQEVVNPDDATQKEITNDIEDTGKNTGEVIDKADAKTIAKEVDAFANIVYNPYGTSNPGKIKKALQRSLVVALRDHRNGIQSDFPNVLIYGQAGVGKTAVVKQFCEEHGIKYLYVKASTLQPEKIAGIPYPVTTNDGLQVQSSVAHPMWRELNKPSILFCDEVNRANPASQDALLGLINEHTLPLDHYDSETDEWHADTFYPNFLFTVCAINPPTAAFRRTVFPLDPAFIGRNSAILSQEADKNEFKDYFHTLTGKIVSGELKSKEKLAVEADKLYKKILDDPNVSNEDKITFQGQDDIMMALMTDPHFQWNTQEEIDDIYTSHKDEGTVYNYLTPRTISTMVRRCNGTKKDFLDVIEHESNLRKEDKQKIKNSLAAYTDKITVGNNVFNGGNNARKTSTPSDSINALDSYFNNLDD